MFVYAKLNPFDFLASLLSGLRRFSPHLGSSVLKFALICGCLRLTILFPGNITPLAICA